MCTLCHIDPQKTEAFGERMMNLLNESALSLMISIGHRTGLFDTMDGMEAATSEAIAHAARLNERYVREWLGAMVTGHIVETISESGSVEMLYHLPAEHAAFLTREAGVDNIGVFAQYIPVLGYVEDDIVRCFHRGGGVSYDQYNRFHEVMQEDSGLAVVSSLIDEVLPMAGNIISQLENGIQVLDIGCGSGRAINLMAQQYPNSIFIGYDLCVEPLETARKEAERLGLSNVYFEQRDLTYAPPEIQFDFITAFDAIHDQARPDKVLSSIYRSLKPEGTFLMVDINASSQVTNNMDHPIGPLLYTISTLHCMTVSLAQDGMGLGAMWGREKANEMLKDVGFTQIAEHLLEQDFQNRYFVIRK
ncbi:MAG: class I SAM-dependent methyltransferase [Bacteroidota bacterium]